MDEGRGDAMPAAVPDSTAEQAFPQHAATRGNRQSSLRASAADSSMALFNWAQSVGFQYPNRETGTASSVSTTEPPPADRRSTLSSLGGVLRHSGRIPVDTSRLLDGRGADQESVVGQLGLTQCFSHPVASHEEANEVARLILQLVTSPRREYHLLTPRSSARADVVSLPSTTSLASDKARLVHNIPIRAEHPNPHSTAALQQATSPESPPLVAKEEHDSRAGIALIAEALADEEMSEEAAKKLVVQVLTEYKQFRETSSAQLEAAEAELAAAKQLIAEQALRIAELEKENGQAARLSASISTPPVGELSCKQQAALLPHTTPADRMSKDDKGQGGEEIKALEDIVKAFLLLHPQQSYPLRLLLSHRLPSFLHRLEEGMPKNWNIGMVLQSDDDRLSPRRN